MSSLLTWAERVIGIVEQDGNRAVRIRLTCEGQQWETWELEKGHLKPGEWVQEAETLMDALAEELSVRRHSLIYTAEEKEGTVFSQFPKSITGRNKQAAELGANQGVKAVAEGVASVVQTADKVLEIARRMMETQQKGIEDRDEEIRQLHELFRAVRAVELEEDQQGNKVSEAMIEQVKELGPIARLFAEAWLEKAAKAPPKTPPAGAGTTNGVHTS